MWCSFVLAPKGNTRVLAKLNAKFLGWIQVNTTDTMLDVQAKASKLLVHALFCHPFYLVVYDSKGKRLSPIQRVLISSLKSLATTLEQIPSEVLVHWDEDVIQQDVANIVRDLPNTTFDGQQITTNLLHNHMGKVDESIELYSLAKTFKCWSKTTSCIDLYWLELLYKLERVEITNCGILNCGASICGTTTLYKCQGDFEEKRIPPTTKNLSIVMERFSVLTSFTLCGVSSLVNLKSLKLQRTLHGSIPDEISKLTNLATLDLAFNVLHGTVPPSIGKLVNLEELFLQFNGLQGRLCLARCTKLQRLDVSHNFFGADLLEDIKLCCAQHVDYSHNNF